MNYQGNVGIKTHLNVFPVEFNTSSASPQWEEPMKV